ncbi:MAG: mechanosensitive ion channel family protein [Azoarcus sp.]|jgi:MscS family membrane protein|nr:mechanosensitive ion channel family protein [Azoarcus sp.]
MEQLKTWLAALTGGDGVTALGLHIMLIVLAIVVFNFVARRVLLHFGKTAGKADTPLELSLVAAARPPLLTLAWVIGISFAGQLVQARTEAAILAFIQPARIVGVIACLGWFLVRFIGSAKEVFVGRQIARGVEVDHTTVDAFAQLLRIAVLITTFLVALQSLGFSIQGVLAFGGIGGIAIGFAAKDLLANFFGSLMIYFDRPFAVGDWIRSPDKQIEGTVEDIGWRLTRIRTFDQRPLYVPNAVFTTITVENPSRMSNRRINETIGVRYDDIGEVAGIVEDIRAMLRAHPEIDQDKTLIVNFLQFNEYSLDIMVYTFTRTTAWIAFHEIKQDVLLKIADIIDRHGAQIAYPTRISYSSPLPPEARRGGQGPATSPAREAPDGARRVPG